MPFQPVGHGPAQQRLHVRYVLIQLDNGFVARIEAERDVLTEGTGHKLPRTGMIRILLKEALDARQRARGERVLAAVAVGAPLVRASATSDTLE